jgi:hypothetical protein
MGSPLPAGKCISLFIADPAERKKLQQATAWTGREIKREMELARRAFRYSTISAGKHREEG